jgi:NAD(P)-dependent dehydrogenase (short-subunit alcohol dehydrogenase family)
MPLKSRCVCEEVQFIALQSSISRIQFCIPFVAAGLDSLRVHLIDEFVYGRAQREGISVDEVERQARRAIPAGRYGVADEFASVAAFLAGAGAAYVTGGVIRVDGGMIRRG